MRVLFVAHNFPRSPGDLPGNFLLRLAVALRESGVEVEVLAPHASGLSDTDLVSGVPVRRFRYAPDERETLAYSGTMAAQVRGSMRAKLDLLAMVRSAARTIAATRQAFDLVHAHWWFPAGLSANSKALGGRPLVTTLHGSDVRLSAGWLGRTLMTRVLRRSTRVTSVSSWLAGEAAGRVPGVLPVVAPMPVATDLFVPNSVSRDGLLFVGKLDGQKGAHVLLEALVRTPHSVVATFVGDGPDARELRARAAALGIAGRVRWIGAVPQADLPRFYQQAQIVVAPATAPEGLGLSAAESLLCETPVIASSVGGLPDLVADGITGRLVVPGDAAGLALAIVSALAEPDRLAAWAREGRARVLTRFSPSTCASQYRTIYDEALRARA